MTVRREQPQLSADWIRASVPYQTPELMERFLDGMRRPGWTSRPPLPSAARFRPNHPRSDDGDPCAGTGGGALSRIFEFSELTPMAGPNPQIAPFRPRAGRDRGDRVPAGRTGWRGSDKIADVAEAVIDAVVNISTSQTVAAGGSPSRRRRDRARA